MECRTLVSTWLQFGISRPYETVEGHWQGAGSALDFSLIGCAAWQQHHVWVTLWVPFRNHQ